MEHPQHLSLGKPREGKCALFSLTSLNGTKSYCSISRLSLCWSIIVLGHAQFETTPLSQNGKCSNAFTLSPWRLGKCCKWASQVKSVAKLQLGLKHYIKVLPQKRIIHSTSAWCDRYVRDTWVCTKAILQEGQSLGHLAQSSFLQPVLLFQC